jgi:streptogramin lyase
VGPSDVVYTVEETRVQEFDGRNGNFLAQWGSAGTGDGQFYQASGIAVDGSYNVFVIDGSGRVQKFDSNGAFLLKWGSPGFGDGQFATPLGIAVDAAGNVYVVDFGGRLQKFDGNGTFLTKWFTFGQSRGVAVDASGNVFVIAGGSESNNRVDKYDSNGNSLAFWGSPGCSDGQFNGPAGVAVDANGDVYVTDMNNHRVQKFTNDGAFIAKWGGLGSGDGQFSFPAGIVVDSHLNVFVADPGNARVQKFGLGIGIGGGECPIVVPPPPPTPEEQVAALSGGVQTLVAGGVLLPAQGNSLLTKLNDALALMTQGNLKGAIAKLGDFTKQVSSFIKTGKLTPEQGQPLIDAAQALAAELKATLSHATAALTTGGDEYGIDAPGTAAAFRLHPGSFDRASGAVTLRFDLPHTSLVSVKFYDVAGRAIDEAELGSLGPGRHEWSWVPHSTGSALLFYRMRAGEITATGKVMLVR